MILFFFFYFAGVTFPAKPWLNYSRTITLEGLSSVSKSETQRRCCRHCWWSRKDTLCSIYILDMACFFSFSWSLPQPQVGWSEHWDSPWGFGRWRTCSQMPQGGRCIETSLPSRYNKCGNPFLCLMVILAAVLFPMSSVIINLKGCWVFPGQPSLKDSLSLCPFFPFCSQASYAKRTKAHGDVFLSVAGLWILSSGSYRWRSSAWAFYKHFIKILTAANPQWQQVCILPVASGHVLTQTLGSHICKWDHTASPHLPSPALHQPQRCCPVVTQRVTGKDRTVFQAFHFLCHLGTPTEGKGHMIPALPSLCCFQTQESLTVGIHPHCCYLDWNWWVLRIQEAVMVPFTILGGEEICWRNWQILRGEKKKVRKTISVKKPMFVCWLY